jgi:hypothetical protein
MEMGLRVRQTLGAARCSALRLYLFKHAQSGRRVIVPHHNKDLKKGTLASIIEQAGTSTTEFLQLL